MTLELRACYPGTSVGLTRAARRAGTNVARSATKLSRTTTPPITRVVWLHLEELTGPRLADAVRPGDTEQQADTDDLRALIDAVSTPSGRNPGSRRRTDALALHA